MKNDSPPTNPPRPPPPVLWSSPHLWLLPWWPGLTSPLPEVLHAHSESCVWCHQNCSLASRSSARERERERNEMTEEVLLFVWMFVCAWYISLIGAVTQALNIIHSNIISETVSPCSHADCTAQQGLCRVIHQMWHGQLLGWYKMSKRSGARTAVVMAIDPSLAPDPWWEVRSLNETCWYGQSGN